MMRGLKNDDLVLYFPFYDFHFMEKVYICSLK